MILLVRRPHLSPAGSKQQWGRRGNQWDNTRLSLSAEASQGNKRHLLQAKSSWRGKPSADACDSSAPQRWRCAAWRWARSLSIASSGWLGERLGCTGLVGEECKEVSQPECDLWWPASTSGARQPLRL